MKLWILRPIDPDNGPWNPWYDKTFGFVVRAETEQQARQLANDGGSDETRERGQTQTPWLDLALASCDELTGEGEAEVVIADHHSA